MPIADDLEIVASYNFLHEADVARSLLEANAIPTWVVDAFHVQQRWYIAGALGGVRIAVPRDQAEQARRNRLSYTCPACGHEWRRDEDAPLSVVAHRRAAEADDPELP